MSTPAPADAEAFHEVSGRRLHYQRLQPGLSGTPLLFLHEGLGSVELWRDFPSVVVAASGHPGLVYSRYGNGRSDPLAEGRDPDYMHREALATLPVVVDELAGTAPTIVGHSDGASIAIIYAGSGHPAERLVLIAPHVFVEPKTVRQIASLRDSFEASDLPARMARYHLDAPATFHGWADIWLEPAFRTWNIEEYLPGIHCPVLLVQGDDDEYGTTRQLDAIARATRGPVERLIIEGAGHAPHLTHAEMVAPAVAGFVDAT